MPFVPVLPNPAQLEAWKQKYVSVSTEIIKNGISQSIPPLENVQEGIEGFISTCDFSSIDTKPGFEGYNVSQMRSAYKVSQIPFTNKPVIAIIIAYSFRLLQEDFDIFCKRNNLPPYKLNVISLGTTQGDCGWSIEHCIDTQWSYAMCENADILVVEAASNYTSDLAIAVEVAKLNGADIISMSFGGSESSNSNKFPLNDLFSGPHIFVAASGDDGSPGWPSTNPNVISVGSVELQLTKDNQIKSQETWYTSSSRNTGCGPSTEFPKPPYQNYIDDLKYSPTRSTCDLSIVGSDDTPLFTSFGKKSISLGGTSYSCPMIAGILANAVGVRKQLGLPTLNSNALSELGVQNILYREAVSNKDSRLFTDVIKGVAGVALYQATNGWDYPTGLGTPVGDVLVNVLAIPNVKDLIQLRYVSTATFKTKNSSEVQEVSSEFTSSGYDLKPLVASTEIGSKWQLKQQIKQQYGEVEYLSFSQTRYITWALSTPTPALSSPYEVKEVSLDNLKYQQLEYQIVDTTTQENTKEENTKEENTTQENTTQENTTQENTTQENTTQENTTQENTTQENTTQENTTQENTTQENTTQENTTQENTTQENTRI